MKTSKVNLAKKNVVELNLVVVVSGC
jgi:hypothetical protein